MIERVIDRLEQIGYSVPLSERSMLSFELDKIIRFIKASCNLDEIDSQLQDVAIERTCGNFLFMLKNYSRLENFNFDGFVKEVLEGDVKVVFDENSVSSDEQRIDKIIDFLMGYGEDILISKRCISW